MTTTTTTTTTTSSKQLARSNIQAPLLKRKSFWTPFYRLDPTAGVFAFLLYAMLSCPGTEAAQNRDFPLSMLQSANPVLDFPCYSLRRKKSLVWPYFVYFGLWALSQAWPQWPSSPSPTFFESDAAIPAATSCHGALANQRGVHMFGSFWPSSGYRVSYKQLHVQ